MYSKCYPFSTFTSFCYLIEKFYHNDCSWYFKISVKLKMHLHFRSHCGDEDEPSPKRIKSEVSFVDSVHIHKPRCDKLLYLHETYKLCNNFDLQVVSRDFFISFAFLS